MDSYVDDTTVTVTEYDIESIENKLTDNCTKGSRWMKSNNLRLNPDKTHLLTLGTQKLLSELPRQLNIKLDNVVHPYCLKNII